MTENKHVVPEFWNAEEALVICAFLESLISSIWKTHGRTMASHMQRIRHLEEQSPPQGAEPDAYDDIPF